MIPIYLTIVKSLTLNTWNCFKTEYPYLIMIFRVTETPDCNLVPRTFPLKNGWGGERLFPPHHFLREKPWGRGCPDCPSFLDGKSSRVQPPSPLRKNRRRGIWGERAAVHRLQIRDIVNHRLTTRKSKARAARGVSGHTRFENFEMLKLVLKRHF